MSPYGPNLKRASSAAGKYILFLSCAALGVLLLLRGYYDWGIPPFVPPALQGPEGNKLLAQIFLSCFAVLLVGLFLTSTSLWTVIILILVPLEFSKPFFPFPALSLLDYVCAGAILVLLLRRGPLALWRQVQQIFGQPSLWLWIGFFAYSLISARLLGGTPRGPLRWVGFLFLYFLGAQEAVEDPLWPRRLCALLAFLGTAVAVHGLYQFWRIPSYVRLEGLFNQHNIFAAYLSLCLPATFIYARLPSRIPVSIRIAMLLLSSIAFVMSYSRGAWLGLAIGSLLLVGLEGMQAVQISVRTSVGLALGFIVLALLVFSVTRQHSDRSVLSLSDRQTYVHAGFRVFREHPWTGLGPGNYSKRIFAYLTEADRRDYKTDGTGKAILGWQHLHNLYLQLLVDLGLIGFLLWSGALGILIWRALKNNLGSAPRIFSVNTVLSISIIAFLVHNIVDIVTVNSFDMVFAVLLATVTYSHPMNIKGADVR